jgi:heat shock protein HslJ
MSRLRRLYPLLATLLATTAACATAAQQPMMPPADVRWTLTHLEGAPVSSASGGREPNIQFAGDGRVTGFTTCNHFFGRYDAPGSGRLRFAELGSTKMACVDPDLGRQEQRFMSVMQRVDRFAVEGETLRLLEGRREVARFARAASR